MKLLRDLNGIERLLKYFRNELNWSYEKISKYLFKRGFRSNDRTVQRLCVKYDILEPIKLKGSFYNRRHTKESKQKMSELSKTSGKYKGENNYFYGKTKELSPNWKGGTSTKRALFYASNDWKNKRYNIMKRDGFSCKECGFSPKSERNSLNVHHIIPLSMDWDQCLIDSNLITLCIPCHTKTFGKEKDLINHYQDIVRTI